MFGNCTLIINIVVRFFQPCSVFDNDHGRYVMAQYEEMLRLLADYEQHTLDSWRTRISARIPQLVRMHLLVRAGEATIQENFHPEMEEAIRETRTCLVMELDNVAPSALELGERSDELHLLRQKLARIVEWYNAVTERTVPCEKAMLAQEKRMLDAKLTPAIESMTWEKYDSEYVDKCYDLVKDYYDRVTRAQANVKKILDGINAWGSVPLFQRKDGLTDTLLDVQAREVQLESRLRKCLVSKRMLERVVVDENYRLYFNVPFSCPCSSGSEDSDKDLDDDDAGRGMRASRAVSVRSVHNASSFEDVSKLLGKFESNLVREDWKGELYKAYEDYVDDLVGKAIMDGIAISIRYIKFEMENRLEHNAPVFEVKYELQKPNAVFIPHLDTSGEVSAGFMAMIDEIIVAIYDMCDMIPRVKQSPDGEPLSYESVLRDNKEIDEMRNDIVRNTKRTALKCLAYVTKFDIYKALWTTDQQEQLQQFLKYSRGLTEEEIEQMAASEEFRVKENKPTLDNFREEMAKYKKLGVEVQQLEEMADIDVWMRIRTKGFKYTLLNELTSWGLLFKNYLRNQVTDSLQELEEFCAEANRIMGQPLDKENLTALLEVMDILNQIEARMMETDRMFDPLKEIAAMLKEYNFEFDNQIYVQVGHHRL